VPSPPPPPHSPAACTPPHIANENHCIICELPHDARARGSCHSSNYSRAVLGGCGRRHSMGGRHRATSMAAHAGSHDRGQVPGALSAAACARRARRDAPYVSCANGHECRPHIPAVPVTRILSSGHVEVQPAASPAGTLVQKMAFPTTVGCKKSGLSHQPVVVAA